MISIRHKGDYGKLTKYLEKMKRTARISILDKYGKAGVEALESATPKDTGLTSKSWYYKIEVTGKTATLTFCNSNIQNGIMIAIILQYGHGTGNGGWVEGRDYINPAIQPIFDEIVNDAWKEVTTL